MQLKNSREKVWKLTSGGNDFIVFDNYNLHFPSNFLPSLTRYLCHRRFGIGADGLFLLEKSPKADIFMHFFNADGSEIGVCGNALRCISWFASQLKYVGSTFTINTIAENYHVWIDRDKITLQFPSPRSIRQNVPFSIPEINLSEIDYFDVGVPHIVVYMDDVENFDVPKWGKILRHHPQWGSQGANVNFLQKISGNEFRQRTYERGVEGETLACGSGAVCSAISTILRGMSNSPVILHQSGGGSLTVEVEREGDKLKIIKQIGTARCVFTGEVYLNMETGEVLDALSMESFPK